MQEFEKNTTDEKTKKSKLGIILAIVAVLVVVGIVVTLIILGKKSNDDKDIKKVSALADYTTFSYEPYTYEVKDEDVSQYIKEMVEYYTAYGEFLYRKDDSRMGTAVKKDDVLDIDFTGYIDGKAFENGSGSTELKIGSNKFIPGFEDALIGAKIGETVDINVTFPKDYGSTDLAGKDAVFIVKIKSCGTDEKLSEKNLYEKLGFDSAAKLQEDIKKYLTENPATTKDDYIYDCKEDYITYIIDNSTFVDLSKDINEYYEIIYGIAEETAKANNMEIETLVKTYYGFESLDAYKDDTMKNAERQVKQKIVLKAIGDKEKIKLADGKYNDYAASLIQNVTQDSVSVFSKNYDEKYGKGAFKAYVNQIYVLDTCFDKYAKEGK